MGDSIMIPPHLNAEAYRTNDSTSEAMSYFEYIRIHKDHSVLVGCSELTGRYWNGGAKILKSIKNSEDISKNDKNFIFLISGNPDGCFIETSNKILLCEDSGTLSIWEQSDNAWCQWEEVITISEHDDAALAVESLNDGKHYVTVGADGNIKVWDVNDLICVKGFKQGNIVPSVAVQPNSHNFVTGSLDKEVIMWHKDNKDAVLEIAELDCGVRSVQWLDENNVLMGDEAGVLSLVDIRQTKSLNHLVSLAAPVHRILAQPGSRNIAVCCDNRTVSVFEVNTDLKLQTLYKNSDKHKNYVRGVAWDVDERSTLHTVAWDGTLQKHTFK